jgi:hypothetical protein
MYSIRLIKSVILVFLGQISGGTKKTLVPYFLVTYSHVVNFSMHIRSDYLIRYR